MAVVTNCCNMCDLCRILLCTGTKHYALDGVLYFHPFELVIGKEINTNNNERSVLPFFLQVRLHDCVQYNII